MTPGACRSALARRARRSPTCAAGWTRSGSLPSKTLPPATGQRPGPRSRRSSTAWAEGRRRLRAPDWNTLVEAGLSLGDRTLWRRTRCCAVTTWPSSSSASAPSASTPAASTASSAGRPQRRSPSSSATPGFRPTDRGSTTVAELHRVQLRNRVPQLVSTVRDRERLRDAPPTMVGRHLAIARAAAWPPPPGPAPQAGGRRGAGDLPAPSRRLRPGPRGKRCRR